MVAIPAACENCGTVFWTTWPFAPSGRTMFGHNTTNCPRCGGWADVAEGIFDFTRDGIAIVTAPQVTYDMLISLRGVVREAFEQDLSVDETKRRAEAIIPAFGGLFRPHEWSDTVKAAGILAVAGVVSAAITTFGAAPPANTTPRPAPPITIDAEALVRALHRLPLELVVRGEVDREISQAIAPPIVDPAESESDPGPSPPSQDPKKDRQP
jgi:hypothetical protein